MSHGLCWQVQEVNSQLTSKRLLGGHRSYKSAESILLFVFLTINV